MNHFIHQLLCLQAEEKNYKNLIFSPLSIEMLLGLILPGTQGQSRQALLKALEISEEEVNSYLATLQTASSSLLMISEEAQDRGNYTNVQLANSLWYATNVQVNTPYKHTIERRFPFEFFQFSQPIKDTLPRINQWASEKTNGLIPSLPINLDKNSIAVLLSALYLKGFWSRKFSPHPQDTDLFYALDGTETVAQYMEIKQDIDGVAKASYLKKENFHALRLFFNDDRLALEVYLPYENTGLKTFIEQLKATDFDLWKDQFIPIPYFYFLLPKFEITDSFKLSKIANKLGLEALFKMSNNLAPMFKSDLPLYFQEIGQEVKIKVKEEGLEAAAVSFGAMAGGGFYEPEKHSMLMFQANHPFLYRIVDTITNKTLFQGIFAEPVYTSNAFLAHLNKRTLTEYQKQLIDLSDEERFVVALLLLELVLEKYPLKHQTLPQLIDKIWVNLSKEPSLRDGQVAKDYSEYQMILHLFNYREDIEDDKHIEKSKFKDATEALDDTMLELLGNFIIESPTIVPLDNLPPLRYFLDSVITKEVQLPNYEALVSLVKTHQNGGYFQRIKCTDLIFDKIPTTITYTEEEKQERAQEKARQEYENRVHNIDSRFKVGITAYAIVQLRNQVGENYHIMDLVLENTWQYLANQTPALKEDITSILMWMLQFDGFTIHPALNVKDKIRLKAIQKKFPDVLSMVRVLLSQFAGNNHWEWPYQEVTEIMEILAKHSVNFPDLATFTSQVVESSQKQENLVLDYSFFDAVAKEIALST